MRIQVQAEGPGARLHDGIRDGGTALQAPRDGDLRIDGHFEADVAIRPIENPSGRGDGEDRVHVRGDAGLDPERIRSNLRGRRGTERESERAALTRRNRVDDRPRAMTGRLRLHERASFAARRIASIGGARPVHSSNDFAAWCNNISRPEVVGFPRRFASATSRVVGGL